MSKAITFAAETDGQATRPEPLSLIEADLFWRLVRQTAKDNQISEDLAERSVVQAAMMLRAMIEHPGVTFYPTAAVDYGWHTFILHTKDYHAFCCQLAGQYLHHNPIEGATDDGALMTGTAAFLRDHGYPVHDELWSAVESVHCSGGESCDNTITCGGDR